MKWNKNGNWLLSGSKDASIKIYDVRVMKDFHTFQAHEGEVNSIEWHPDCEELFVSGGNDGKLIYWMANEDKIYEVEDAHQGPIWDVAWHPMGNSLATAGNDAYLQLWARAKPGEEIISPTKIKEIRESENVLPSGNPLEQMQYKK